MLPFPKEPALFGKRHILAAKIKAVPRQPHSRHINNGVCSLSRDMCYLWHQAHAGLISVPLTTQGHLAWACVACFTMQSQSYSVHVCRGQRSRWGFGSSFIRECGRPKRWKVSHRNEWRKVRIASVLALRTNDYCPDMLSPRNLI